MQRWLITRHNNEGILLDARVENSLFKTQETAEAFVNAENNGDFLSNESLVEQNSALSYDGQAYQAIGGVTIEPIRTK
jgi:hypothetical protein